MIPISFKTTTYGRVNFLEEALFSFLQQDYEGEMEMVIVNDCPFQNLYFNHPLVRVINLKETFPVIGEKENFAINQCKHDCIVTADDDDLTMPWAAKTINEYFPGHDLLHWNTGILMHGYEIKAIQAIGNSGIVYSKNFVNKMLGGYPKQHEGADMELVLGIQRAGGKVARVVMPKDRACFVYNWGNGSFHLSGLGAYKEGRDDIVKRHSAHIEALRERGEIPEGDIELKPHWNRDYIKMLNDFVKVNGV